MAAKGRAEKEKKKMLSHIVCVIYTECFRRTTDEARRLAKRFATANAIFLREIVVQNSYS